MVINLVWFRSLVLTRSLLAALDSPPWVFLNLCLPPSTSFSSSLNLFRASKTSASLSPCFISLT